jgi:hypothetical protein
MFRLLRAHVRFLISTLLRMTPCGAAERSGNHAAMKVLETIKA